MGEMNNKQLTSKSSWYEAVYVDDNGKDFLVYWQENYDDNIGNTEKILTSVTQDEKEIPKEGNEELWGRIEEVM